MLGRPRSLALGLRLVVAALLTALCVGGLVRLYSPTLGPGGAAERQLAFIRQQLEAGAGDDAQGLFPEGYFFLHELYALAWVDVGRHRADRAEALRNARWALSRLDGPQGTAPFTASLSPRYGIFYAGWTNWLRGGILSLQPAGERDPGEVERFERDSRAIAAAFDGSPTPFLTAYPQQSWPVDSTVAIASLRLHDALLPAAYGSTVQHWVAAARERLDPATGLLPHVTDPVTGAPLQGARGSSQSVIQRFLVDVDPGFAREQYLKFRAQFVVRPLWLGPAVREYPQGTDGPGDVDSGPLPLGVSLSATVVTIGAARVQRDDALAGALSSYGELAGVPVDTLRTKRYALGQLPIGDAFLVWARTAEPWVAGGVAPAAATIGPLWKLPLTFLLLFGGNWPLLVAWLVIRRQAQRREQAGDGPGVGGVADPVVPERL
ncbi:hypothetical protein AB0M46_49310 [Dactylosporangium sp. NPDC051485]|uniref:hypothetical protein n=1 Tax=Dactylosporangium sp. NPDC051485 TaxID=3154846 RepID=UPI00342A5C62